MPKIINTEQLKDKIEVMSRRYSANEIANLLNVSLSFVVKTRRERNVSQIKPHKSLVMSQERQETIANEYFINGLTNCQIMAKYGLTHNEFRQITYKYKDKFQQKKSGVTTGRKEKVVAMLQNGVPPPQIVKTVGVSKQYVYWLRANLN